MGSPTPKGLEAVLGWIERKRLQAPAAMLLEMHRPLAPLAWTAAMLAGPAIAPFVGPDYYERIQALKDPALLDQLLERLEASKKQGKAEQDRQGSCNTPTR